MKEEKKEIKKEGKKEMRKEGNEEVGKKMLGKKGRQGER